MDSQWKAQQRGLDSRFRQREDHEATVTDSCPAVKWDPPNSPSASAVKMKWTKKKNIQKKTSTWSMHSPVVYEQGCRVTGCLQRRRRQQVCRMTFTKNNLSKFDKEHACASKKEKRQRETDGVCCRVPSLWNLGYSFTAAGPACAHTVYLPCAGQWVNHLRGVNIQTAELYPPAVYCYVQARLCC